MYIERLVYICIDHLRFYQELLFFPVLLIKNVFLLIELFAFVILRESCCIRIQSIILLDCFHFILDFISIPKQMNAILFLFLFVLFECIIARGMLNIMHIYFYGFIFCYNNSLI